MPCPPNVSRPIAFLVLRLSLLPLCVFGLSLVGCKESSPASERQVLSQSPASKQPSTQAVAKSNILRDCDRADALDVLEKTTVMADVLDTGKEAVYRFKASWWETLKMRAGEMIHGFADADACSNQSARTIVFYDPDGGLSALPAR